MASKLCFVTVGATASFSELVKAVLSSDFLSALKKEGYTELLVQYGKEGKAQFNQAVTSSNADGTGVTVSGLELDRAGLGKYMRSAKGGTSAMAGQGRVSQEGVVISHAGSGTILDALRVAVPLIVVPNTSLLDNHQIELAEALAEQDYVVHGRLDRLAQALSDAETLRKRHKEWPPVNSGMHAETKGLKGVLDDEMGFLD